MSTVDFMNASVHAQCPCPKCGGTGIKPGADVQTQLNAWCRECDGTGRSYVNITIRDLIELVAEDLRRKGQR